MPITRAQPTDRRAPLGFWLAVALVVGNMIGSGVYLLPASLAPYGLNSLIGWAFTIAGAMLLAFVFAELARAHPLAGGPYAYPRLAFGPLVGFLVAWGYWTSVWVGVGGIAIATVAYLAELLPFINARPGAPAAAAVAMIWLLTLLNWRGVRQAGVFQLLTTVLKLLPLIAVIVLAVMLLARGDAAVIRVQDQPFSMQAITASATLTLWALLGLESASASAGRVAEPGRTIPRATLWGTFAAALIYVAVCTTIMLLTPGAELAESTAPFADVLRLFWGDRAAEALALFAFISGFGALNGWILIQGEMPRVLARDGVFPRIFGLETRYGTPGAALFITSALATALVLMNYSASMVRIFTFAVLVATASSLVMYLTCALAALKLASRGELGAGGRRLRLLIVVAVLAALYSLWTLYGAGAEAVLWNIALFAAGVPVYFFMQRARARC